MTRDLLAPINTPRREASKSLETLYVLLQCFILMTRPATGRFGLRIFELHMGG
jgi:hypothetical protein